MPYTLVSACAAQSCNRTGEPPTNGLLLHDSSVRAVSPKNDDKCDDSVSTQEFSWDEKAGLVQDHWYHQTQSNSKEGLPMHYHETMESEAKGSTSNPKSVPEAPQIVTKRQTRSQTKRKLEPHQQSRTRQRVC